MKIWKISADYGYAASVIEYFSDKVSIRQVSHDTYLVRKLGMHVASIIFMDGLWVVLCREGGDPLPRFDDLDAAQTWCAMRFS